MSHPLPTIGFIGLGAMGGGMSRNVAAKHGGTVLAYDMNPEALAATVAAGAVAAASVPEIGAKADIVLLSLPGGKQVAAVCEEIAAQARPGAIVVDLSTTGVDEARAVHAALADKGIAFADAPVARARAAADAGTLSIMVGASEALFARIEPVLRYMGTDVTRCGEVGCGQVVKLVNNSLLFEHVAALAEMMVVSERAGVPPATLLDVLAISSADSFALRNHGMKAMLPRDFPEKAFPSPYVLKDLGYAIEMAEGTGVDARMSKLAGEYYRAAVEQGIGAKYFPAIIELIGKA
ncbi:NAD(P)-dependent oxidoreductase [Sphingomonas naphthae]|uniref:NAD(P)-dependent oxidoreductase n=1 Tax=Sphingomonas naphthae TaxID=1813468 RepID=A0ABY7TPL4_9SPHN|nr:NAD(P)-dependent oxidoreductase [Sphingomonas naphthae]WCT75182.1 NAD(P)-dependent oxidoreductase [Sphingomonas naphthae]